MAFISSARSTIRSTRLTRSSRLPSGRRHASSYNTEVAGLSEEQAEVRRSLGDDRCVISLAWSFSSGMRSRSSHNESLLQGQQKSTGPTRSHWSVPHSCIPQPVLMAFAGCLGEAWRDGLAGRNGFPQVRGPGFGVLPPYLGHGGALARIWLCRVVLWCPFKPLREPDPPTRHGGTER